MYSMFRFLLCLLRSYVLHKVDLTFETQDKYSSIRNRLPATKIMREVDQIDLVNG
jgi:hypothetical protein